MRQPITSTLLTALLFSLAVGSSLAAKKVAPSQGQVKAHPSNAVALRDAMRKLWEDHITWTRLFIVSAAADLPDKETVTERLVQNQVDIGNAIKPYYGNAAGEKLASLLKEHITTAAELVGAAKAGNTPKMAQ
jgi:hypothetical protein